MSGWCEGEVQSTLRRLNASGGVDGSNALRKCMMEEIGKKLVNR